MNEQERARALAARLARFEGGDFGVAAPNEVADEDAQEELVKLAAQLRNMGNNAHPSPEFRATLATRLSLAPPPSTLPATSTRELSRSLDDAIQRIAGGVMSEKVDHELEPLVALAGMLHRAPAAPGPSPAFRRQLRERLDAAPRPTVVAQRRPAAVLRRLWRSTAFTAAAAATIVLFLVSGVTYAAADALPGEPLYPVKRTAERVRLAVADPIAALGLHLDFASLRLGEALAANDHAGHALADFSREVTAALAAADGLLAGGGHRDAIVSPLLQWLTAARVDLVLHRESLPPTAWRGALALVDEAIVALGSGAPLTDRPIPRLADPVAVLALRSDATFRRAWLFAPPAHGPPDAGDELVARLTSDADEAGDAAAVLQVGARPVVRPTTAGSEDQSTGATAGQSAGAEAPGPGTSEGGTGAAPGGSASAPPSGENPGRRQAAEPGRREPQPTREPQPPSPAATVAPRPTAEAPAPAPTATHEPPSEPVVPSPTAVVPPPTQDPTPTEPSPTPTSRPSLPAAFDVVCTPNTLLPAGLATCTVELAGEPQEDWRFAWEPSLGEIVAPHPELGDGAALYTATSGFQGVEKVYATISVTIEDAVGGRVSGSTFVYIVPRLSGGQASPPSERGAER